jgi:hypothetical protein
MTQPGNSGSGQAAQIAALESAVATLQSAVKALQVQLAAAVDSFTPVGQRVTELSAAFQDANGRLAAAETTLVGLSQDGEVAELVQRVQDLGATVEGFDARLSAIENVRARSGRTGVRLSNIEQTLQQILQNTTGGTASGTK